MRPASAQVGKYQVLERLAVGGMAELFKAKVAGDHGFEKVVVIKKILPHLATDPQFVRMFIDEARLTAGLDHPNIVQVFELGSDADTPYIAMQFVDGIDALELLRECARTQIRLPPALAALIARDVLDALDYAHHATGADGRPLGLVHRDVSPGNILVSRRGDVKLTDFGIARAAERSHHTEAGILKGKYGYMSPEQVSGGELDERSDIFSLAIVLVELVMARRLFSAANDLDVLLMVRAANLERLHRHADEVPAELRSIAEHALRRRADERWASAGAMRDALTGWLHGHGRPDARDLAGFVARLQAAPTAMTADAPSAGTGTLSGPQTRLDLAHAAAERKVARAEFIAGISRGTPEPILEDEPSHDIVVTMPEVASGPGPRPPPSTQVSRVAPAPHDTGDLKLVSPTRMLHRLTRDRATGLLVLEGRAGILKEVYLGDGHPQYVSSNVTSERLGDFLIGQGVVSAAALDRAVAVMPRFGNRLADTLVGLGLLSALEAYRLLTAQVTGKLIDVCGWSKGRYRWYLGRANPFSVQPLHLDAFRVLATGASALDASFVDDWLATRLERRPGPAAGGPADLDDFGLGEALVRVHAMLDGRATIGELTARIRSEEARLNFSRLLYLLVETERVTLE
jgi:serine/threonine protein kinase